MSEDDPPPENGDGDLVRVAASSDTEFLGSKEGSITPSRRDQGFS
jgi:hypothetical protein